jgi:hypothetical protein
LLLLPILLLLPGDMGRRRRRMQHWPFGNGTKDQSGRMA